MAVLHEDGFEGIKKILPPPARRALVLCDPSYEIKSDYAKVLDMVGRFAQAFCHGHLCVLVPHHPAPQRPTTCPAA